ncbi:hypothetical protein [Arthrobacter sp. Soil736]|uniref:hypothetical protein n=1 Tax=Arthrobacter sp. Soil736 TaxID=1736395 RepID=UPI000ADF87FF|nr:hypothetical protein [Arthrobacter sp. Soil736]
MATDPRRQSNPKDFAQSRETFYILSKEGAGSAARLTTALAVAIAEAMEERAERAAAAVPASEPAEASAASPTNRVCTANVRRNGGTPSATRTS